MALAVFLRIHKTCVNRRGVSGDPVEVLALVLVVNVFVGDNLLVIIVVVVVVVDVNDTEAATSELAKEAPFSKANNVTPPHDFYPFSNKYCSAYCSNV